ncbi:unnamed protein product, partial [marine sediment metagenome]
SNSIKRLLLLTQVPIEDNFIPGQEIQTTVWEFRPQDYISGFEFQVQKIDYQRNPDEIKFISKLLKNLESYPDDRISRFQKEIFLRQASSSIYAIEKSLTRRRNMLAHGESGAIQQIVEGNEFSDIESDLNYIESSDDITDKVTVLDDINGIIELIELVDVITTDKKLNTLKLLVEEIYTGNSDGHIIIFTEYLSTGSYLSSVFDKLDCTTHFISSSIPHREVSEKIITFKESGGILIISGAHQLKGIDFTKLDALVIYDLFGRNRKPIQKTIYIGFKT